jgi:hypothetical protein
MDDTKAHLVEILRSVLSREQFVWLDSAMRRIQASPKAEHDLAELSASARRRVGESPLNHFPASPSEALQGVDVTYWGIADAVRIALLLTALNCEQRSKQNVIDSYYQTGDEQEKKAVLQALSLLDPDGALRSLALSAARTNSVFLFGALACDNPYPAENFQEREFNQLALKALHLGFGMDRIAHLDARLNPELSQMCSDYCQELLFAGRAVPSTIWLGMVKFADPQAQNLVTQFLFDADPNHRFHIVCALLPLDDIPPVYRSPLDGVRRQINPEREPQTFENLLWIR